MVPVVLLFGCSSPVHDAATGGSTLPDTTGDSGGETKDHDADGDGHDAIADGGDDCDDTDAAIFPGAYDRPDDGVDEDCDGYDLATIQVDVEIAPTE